MLSLTSLKIANAPEAEWYLSRNCLIYPNDKLLIDKVILPNSWETKDEIHEFKAKVWMSYEQLLPELVKFFNEYHGIDEDKKFWERLLGQWLYIYVANYLEKLNRLTRAFDINPGLVAQGINVESYKTPKSVKQFVSLLRTKEEFHLQQFSVILNNHFHENVELYPLEWSVSEDSDDMSHDKGRRNLKYRVVSFLQNVIPSGYRTGQNAIYVALFSNKELLRLCWKTKFKTFPIFAGYSKEYKIETDIFDRLKLNLGTISSTENQKILDSLKFFIPSEFLEGFREIYQSASNNLRKNIPQKIVTGIGFFWNSEFAVWASLCSNHGTHIYGCQHGGAYGDVEMISDEYFERKNSDTYLTWGWTDGSDTKSFYSPLLQSRQIEKQVNQNGILWVTTGDSRFQYFVEQIASGERFYQYFEKQQSLFNALDQKIQEKVQVRIYPIDFDWKFKERWLDKFPQIKVAQPEESFLSQIEKSEFVIIDHLGGTTTLECLHLEKPFIILASEDLFEIRCSAKKIHDQLNAVGILHYNPKSAADLLNDVGDDIDGWWASEKRQEVLRCFKAMYAATEEKNLSEWVKLLV